MEIMGIRSATSAGLDFVDLLGKINWWTVALAAFAYFLLGAAWFTPLLGNAWDRAIGFQRTRGHRFPPIYYIAPLLCSIGVTIATAMLVAALDLRVLTDAVALGLTVGIGYAVTISFTNALTPNTPRPILLGAVTAGYHLVGLVIVSTILVGLR